MSPNNGTLFHGVLGPRLLNDSFASFSFINLDFLLLHTAHFDDNIDQPFFVFFFSLLSLQFLFSVPFLYFKQYANMFYMN